MFQIPYSEVPNFSHALHRKSRPEQEVLNSPLGTQYLSLWCCRVEVPLLDMILRWTPQKPISKMHFLHHISLPSIFGTDNFFYSFLQVFHYSFGSSRQL